MSELIKSLNQLAEHLERNYHKINSGGCAIVAEAMYKHFQQLNVPVQYVILNEGEETDINRARESINRNSLGEWFDRGIDFGHVVVEFELESQVFAFDSKKGVETDYEFYADYEDYYGRPVYGIQHEEIVELLQPTNWTWNPRFSVDQIPGIREAISETFNKIVDLL